MMTTRNYTVSGVTGPVTPRGPPISLLLILFLSGCVSQSNLDHRLDTAEQVRIQRDILEVQREQLLLNELQQRRR